MYIYMQNNYINYFKPITPKYELYVFFLNHVSFIFDRSRNDLSATRMLYLIFTLQALRRASSLCMQVLLPITNHQSSRINKYKSNKLEQFFIILDVIWLWTFSPFKTIDTFHNLYIKDSFFITIICWYLNFIFY